MTRPDPEIVEALSRFDSPTLFNALAEITGLPNEEYTDHTIRCLLPDLGPAVGYAVTAEVTTNDPDSPQVPWPDYYEWLEGFEGPMVTVLQDVDSRPGRGACIGDGMAALHRRLGVVGAVVDGTARDLPGIRRFGLPVWGWGAVPGHGVFHLVRFGGSVTAGQLRIHAGDLLVADLDGCVRLPAKDAEEIVKVAGEVREMEAGIHTFYSSPDFTVEAMRRRK